MHRLDTRLVVPGQILSALELTNTFTGFGKFLLEAFGFLVAHPESLNQRRQAVLPVLEFLV